jgi:hypothetical protein
LTIVTASGSPELDEIREAAFDRYYAALESHPITSTVRKVYASLAGVSAFPRMSRS